MQGDELGKSVPVPSKHTQVGQAVDFATSWHDEQAAYQPRKEAIVGAHLTYNDIRAFVKAHPESGEPSHQHKTFVVATDQVHLICWTCGMDVTADAVDAGHAVVHEKEAK